MSGHSAWANIKHKKQANDAKRGKIFSKVAKEMMISVRANGKDPITNLTLRTLLQKARAANMPSANIERAIQRGAGEVEGEVFEEVYYEGYALGGVGLIVQVLTSNRNRAAAEVRARQKVWYSFELYEIFCELAHDHLIPLGDYLIEACW